MSERGSMLSLAVFIGLALLMLYMTVVVIKPWISFAFGTKKVREPNTQVKEERVSSETSGPTRSRQRSRPKKTGTDRQKTSRVPEVIVDTPLGKVTIANRHRHRAAIVALGQSEAHLRW